MADELEEFLRQAAARRQQRQKGAGNKPASGGPAARPTAAGSSPDRFAGSSKEGVGNTGAGVVRGGVQGGRDESLRVEPRRLEPSLESRHVETVIDQADEQIDAYVDKTMASDLRPMGKGSMTSSKGNLHASASAPQSQPQVQAQVSSKDLIKQLRNPDTLRMAIIAHEILRRPYE
jgi:hypothetical protein